MWTWLAARRRRAGVLSPVVALIALAGCDSDRLPPVGPSVDRPPVDSPPPETTPFRPVDPDNVRALPAPAVPPRSTDPIVGRHTLDIVVGESGLNCESVPAYAKRRTYTADIHDLGDSYAVNLYDATFLADGTRVSYGCRDRRLPYDGACHQFLISRDGSSTLFVNIMPEDEWRGSEIWEVLPDGHLLQIHGEATGSARDGRIEAVGTGGLWYGDGLPASTVFSCGTGELRLTFVRR